MAKNKRIIPVKEFNHSLPTIATTPICPLNLGQIIHAVKVCRSSVGADGCRNRWGEHPLYEAAVHAIENNMEYEE